MPNLLDLLKRKDRRGSKPRCHWLTHGSPSRVAANLTALVEPFATITEDDSWMPQGFDDLEEAQLHTASRLIDSIRRTQLRQWWLGSSSGIEPTPSFDIASTCTVYRQPGLVLVEAKAYDRELQRGTAAKLSTHSASLASTANHARIERAIVEAAAGLQAATASPWRISRDSHYQMSNRFAWSWKLTEIGIPVVLVYLGFLRAAEMADLGRPLADHEEWRRLVLEHSRPLFSSAIWEEDPWTLNGRAFVPLIRSLELSLSSSSDSSVRVA